MTTFVLAVVSAFTFAGGSDADLAIALAESYGGPVAIGSNGVNQRRFQVTVDVEDPARRRKLELEQIASLTGHTLMLGAQGTSLAMSLESLPYVLFEGFKPVQGAQVVEFDLTQITITESGLVDAKPEDNKLQCLYLLRTLNWTKPVIVNTTLAKIPFALTAENAKQEDVLRAFAKVVYGDLIETETEYRIEPDPDAFRAAFIALNAERERTSHSEVDKSQFRFIATALKYTSDEQILQMLSDPKYPVQLKILKGSKLEEAAFERVSTVLEAGRPVDADSEGSGYWKLIQNKWDRTQPMYVYLHGHLAVWLALSGHVTGERIIL